MAKRATGRYWAGFDLGGTKMMATIYDASFKACGSRRRKTKECKGARDGTRLIIQMLEEALQDAEVTKGRLGAIGVGCPGVLDLDRGVILQAPNLGWRNVRLASALEEEFGCSEQGRVRGVCSASSPAPASAAAASTRGS